MISTTPLSRSLERSCIGAFLGKRAAAILAVSVVVTVVFSQHARGATYTWNNTGTQWTTASCWDGTVVPGTTDSVVFGSMGTAATTVNVSSSKTTTGITFNSDAYAYKLTKTNGNLTIGSGGVTNNSVNTQTFNGSYLFTNSQTWQSVSGGAIVVNGSIDMNASSTASRTFYVGGAGNAVFNGVIQNSYAGSTGNINVTSTGTVTLAGLNTYNGVTTLNTATGVLLITGTNSSAGTTVLTSGYLKLGSESNGGLASGLLTLTGGTLEAVDRDITLNNTVAYVGTTISGTENLTLNGTLTGYTGADRTVTNNMTSDKVLTLTNVNINSQTGAVRNLTIAGSGNTVITGTISNGTGTTTANGLNITSTGVTTISGTGTYTGATNVTAGKLVVSGAITAGTTTVSSGATLAGGANLTSSVATLQVAAGATILPGDIDAAGTLNTEALTFADSSSHLVIELGTSIASDQIATTLGTPVTVSLGGASLDISLLDDYLHVDGERFLIINNLNDSSVLSGMFASGTSQIVVGSETFSVLYNANYDASGTWVSDTGGNDVALIAVPEPGTWALIMGGLGMLSCVQRWSRRGRR